MRKVAKGSSDFKKMHLSLLTIHRDELVREFEEHSKVFPADLLKNALKKRATNAE